MKGVSEIIAIILILMITIAISGLAYTFMSSTMASTTSSASAAVTSTTTSIKTSFVIESVDVAKVYIRNTGDTVLTNMSVYVNNNPAKYNITPAISPGQVGIITIYDFLNENDEIKILSAGSSVAKMMTDPCKQSIGCWHFDEGSGSIVYDSSPYANHGSIIDDTNWTSGKYGSGLLFDGVNDYVEVPSSTSFNVNELTILMWIKTPSNLGCGGACHRNILSKQGGDRDYNLYTYSSNGANVTHIHFSSGRFGSSTYILPQQLDSNTWHYVTLTVDSSGLQKYYYDGNLIGTYQGTPGNANNSYPIWIARADNVWKGVIDEVRVYNRAIY